ncbi:MAG: signal recognition particle receptor subunit alpha, partial [Gammaproteobacteria bacterium]|nr:signal recognition particle receptor subunit alpha [Gammaproteobacteria bacterium]
MFGFGKKKTSSQTPPPEQPQAPSQEAAAPKGLFARLKAGLARTRANLGDALGDLLSGKRQIDDDLLDELETLLLTADVGVDATRRIIDDLTTQVRRKELSDPQALGERLRTLLADILRKVDKPAVEAPVGRPLVILMVGINGAG